MPRPTQWAPDMDGLACGAHHIFPFTQVTSTMHYKHGFQDDSGAIKITLAESQVSTDHGFCTTALVREPYPGPTSSVSRLLYPRTAATAILVFVLS